VGEQVLPVEVLGILESGVDETPAVVVPVVDLSREDVRQGAALGRIGHLLGLGAAPRRPAPLARLPQTSATSPEAGGAVPHAALLVLLGGRPRPVVPLARRGGRHRRPRPPIPFQESVLHERLIILRGGRTRAPRFLLSLLAPLERCLLGASIVHRSCLSDRAQVSSSSRDARHENCRPCAASSLQQLHAKGTG